MSLDDNIENTLHWYEQISKDHEQCQIFPKQDRLWEDYLKLKREKLLVLPLDVILNYERDEIFLALFHYDNFNVPYDFIWIHNTLNGYTYWYKSGYRMYKCTSKPFNTHQKMDEKIKFYKTWQGITKRVIKEFGGVVYCSPIIHKEFFDGKIYKPTF